MKTERLHFGNLTIPIFRSEDKVLWPVRAICNQLDIGWILQSKKLKAEAYRTVRVDSRLLESPGMRSQECLEQQDFERWLRSLNEAELSGQAHEKVKKLHARVFYKKQPLGRTKPEPADILEALTWWRIESFCFADWSTLQAGVERAFQKSFGCSYYCVTLDNLDRAIDQLCVILFNLKKPLASTANERLYAAFERLLTTIGYDTAKANSADVTMVLNTLEQAYAENKAWQAS